MIAAARGQVRAVAMPGEAGPALLILGLDFGALLAAASARGVPAFFAAEVLAFVEPTIVSGLNRELQQ